VPCVQADVQIRFEGSFNPLSTPENPEFNQMYTITSRLLVMSKLFGFQRQGLTGSDRSDCAFWGAIAVPAAAGRHTVLLLHSMHYYSLAHPQLMYCCTTLSARVRKRRARSARCCLRRPH
jgi:hypothetical protein